LGTEVGEVAGFVSGKEEACGGGVDAEVGEESEAEVVEC
jgi:hypothetical protein